MQDEIADVAEVKELLGLLKNNNFNAQAKDFEVLLSSVDAVYESTYGIIEQNNTSIIKIPFKNKDGANKICSTSINESAIRLNAVVSSVKHEVLKASVNIVNNFKEKGFIALKGNEFDVIKQSLGTLGLRVAEDKIATKNAINSFSEKTNGKENIHLNNYLQILLGAEENFIISYEKTVALSKGANYKQTQEEKPSVLQKLKDEKANIKESTSKKSKTKEQTI